jgi:hypothetical protein
MRRARIATAPPRWRTSRRPNCERPSLGSTCSSSRPTGSLALLQAEAETAVAKLQSDGPAPWLRPSTTKNNRRSGHIAAPCALNDCRTASAD